MAFPFIVILNLISTLLDQFAKNKIYKKKVKQLSVVSFHNQKCIGSETTLRSYLVRPNDADDQAKQVDVVHRIPRGFGKAYIDKNGRSMQVRMREHDRNIRLTRTQYFAISELAHNSSHRPLLNDIKFFDRDPHFYTRKVKETIRVRLHLNNINRDSEAEI